VPAGEVHKDIFETCLPGREVKKLGASFSDGFEQGRDGQMRLTHGERADTVVVTYAFHSGKDTPMLIGVSVAGLAYAELDNMVTSESINEIRWRTLGDDLAVVDDGEAIAKTLGLVHVVGGKQHRATGTLKGADDIPKLAATLRVKTGGGFVEEKYLGIADEGSGDGEALPLPAGKLADPGVGLLGKLKFVENFVTRARLLVETRKEFDRLSDREFLGEACFLERDPKLLAQCTVVGLPALAENRYFARRRLEKAFENFDGCGLACPVGSEKSETFARVNGEIQAADRFDFAVVGFAQVTALNGGSHSGILA
jgi:hypothetical protein